MKQTDLVVGIDVGTQGARVVACDPQGNVLAQAEHPFSLEPAARLPEGWIEQNPDDWWIATVRTLREVIGSLVEKGRPADCICGVSVTSTSGTVLALDKDDNALGSALMYNDRRSDSEAKEVNRVGAELASKLGYKFASSFALPKIVWLRKNDPNRFGDTRFFLSPTDFIVGKLTGVFDVTDYTNALKTGYDLIDQRWPAFLEHELGVRHVQLPRVIAPGIQIGTVTHKAFQECGLRADTPVLAGMTDGCSSQVSTGAVAPGQWNSTLGTTLVIKGVTPNLIRDAAGRVYCHRHPDGHWLPGGASNTGGECIARKFDKTKLESLGAQASKLTPTNVLAYPLTKTGERFPFANPKAEGFLIGKVSDEATLYTSYLEGVAYIERLSYDVLKQLGAEVGGEIYVAGGATKAAAWLQIRADVLQKALLVPAVSGGAMGAAILAASGTIYNGIVPAAKAMVRISKVVKPRAALKGAYDERYTRFCTELRKRGYLGERE
jgi:xylulokinase